MTPDHSARLRLRVAVKLLIGLAFGACAVVALGFIFGAPAEPGPVRRIALDAIAPGETRTVGHDNRAVIILHRRREAREALAAGEHPDWLVVHARGTGQGCPVVWQKQDRQFRESCGNLRYDAAGRSLTEGYRPLSQPIHRIEDGVLILGRD